MKKCLCSLILIVTTNISISQTTRYERSYNVLGLPNSDDVGESLIIAIPLLLIGFIIAYVFMWSKKAQKNENSKITNIGCIGIATMGVGVVFLFPLFTWIEYIGMSLAGVGLIIGAIVAVLYFISSLFKKNR